MKHDFHAQFPLALQESVPLAFAIPYLVGKEPSPPDPCQEFSQITDEYARMMVLAQAMATGRKNEARVGSGKDAGGLRFWIDRRSQAFFKKRLEMIQQLQALPTHQDLTNLPNGSWSLQFTFNLRKPYLSRDDTDFYILDNPVKKEHVFKLPYVASTQWKGTLRHAFRLLGYQEADEPTQGLFGTANDDQPEDGNRGRLYFYPTFFHRLGMEVINPHDRESGAGKNPIYFEVVPPGTSGVFTLLYTPLDRICKDETETKQQVMEDLIRVAEALKALFTEVGFGPKTGSGFGLADDAVENGKLVLKWPGTFFLQIEKDPVQTPDDSYLKYLDEVGQIKPDFLGGGDYGLMSNKEYREKGAQLGGGSLAEFKTFRRWYGESGEAWQQKLKEKTKDVTDENYHEVEFNQLSQLAENFATAQKNCWPGECGRQGGEQ